MNFIEDKFPSVVLLFYFIINIIYFFMCYFTNIFSVENWETYYQAVISFYSKNNSILITVGSILIGIYFTVFSILGSLNINSTFAMISRENFLKLIKFILYAFVSSFLFIFLMLFVYALPKIVLPYYLLIIITPLLLYIFCSSLRLGIFLFLIYRREIDSLHSKLKAEERKEDEMDDIMHRMEVFLKDYEEKKEQEYLRNRKNNIDE